MNIQSYRMTSFAHKYLILFKLCIVLAAVACSLPEASAQRDKNYIYLFDCTQSMQWTSIDGGKTTLWDSALESLDKTLAARSSEQSATVSVVPFQGQPYPAISFAASDYAARREGLFGKLQEYILQKTNTDIVNTIGSGSKLIDPAKDNRIYLLTDGQDTRAGAAGVEAMLRAWCGKYANTRLYYIMLSRDAVSPDILSAVEFCPDIYAVEPVDGSIPLYTDLEGNVIYASTLDLAASHPMLYSETGTQTLGVRCDDPYFSASIEEGRSVDGKFSIRLSARGAMDTAQLNEALAPHADAAGNYLFDIEVVPADKLCRIINPVVHVVMANKALRKLCFGGEESLSQINIEPATHWHDSFLWSDAAEQTAVRLPVDAVFNDAALADGATATLRITPADGEPADYTLYVDGEASADGVVAVSGTHIPEVALIFDTDAREGKRHFNVTPERATGLDLVNGAPVAEHRAFTIRHEYDVEWNPLKTALFWLLIAIVAALVLWFAIVRPARYPAIKPAAVTLTGPGSFYSHKRIKHARRIVLTRHSRRQSTLSRIFTGTTLFIRSEHFTSDMTILPASKKKVRLRLSLIHI